MIPDYCEALTAYRCWNAYPNGLLVGQAHNEPWPPFQPMVARCGFIADGAAHLQDGVFLPAPVLGCDCGVYALKSPDATETRLIDEIRATMSALFAWSRDTPKGRVWGAVKLWGRVIEHEIGYRAECAYPSALWCEDEALASTVATLYGVPCAVKTLPRPPARDKDADDAFVNFYTQKILPPLYITPSPATIRLLRHSPYGQPYPPQAPAIPDLRSIWRDTFKKAFYAVKTDVP